MKHEAPARRKDEDTRDIVIEVRTELAAHTKLDAEFHDEIKADIAHIDSKLDKLNRNHAFGLGGLGVLYILLQFPQLLHTIEPAQAQEIPHAGQKFERPASRH